MSRWFVPIFCEMADKTVKRIEKQHLDGAMFDITLFTEYCAMEMILASSFDFFVDEQIDGEEKIERLIKGIRE